MLFSLDKGNFVADFSIDNTSISIAVEGKIYSVTCSEADFPG
jgi:hypothetical protein